MFAHARRFGRTVANLRPCGRVQRQYLHVHGLAPAAEDAPKVTAGAALRASQSVDLICAVAGMPRGTHECGHPHARLKPEAVLYFSVTGSTGTPWRGEATREPAVLQHCSGGTHPDEGTAAEGDQAAARRGCALRENQHGRDGPSRAGHPRARRQRGRATAGRRGRGGRSGRGNDAASTELLLTDVTLHDAHGTPRARHGTHDGPRAAGRGAAMRQRPCDAQQQAWARCAYSKSWRAAAE